MKKLWAQFCKTSLNFNSIRVKNICEKEQQFHRDDDEVREKKGKEKKKTAKKSFLGGKKANKNLNENSELKRKMEFYMKIKFFGLKIVNLNVNSNLKWKLIWKQETNV